MDSSLDVSPQVPAIEFRNVSLSFEGKVVLQNISFALDKGQMLIVTGVSGSGKTVLLHLAIGLFQPDEGEVLVEGQDIAKLKERDLLEVRSRRMGLVFQEDALFTGLTVFDNTAYRLQEHNWPDEEIEYSVPEILRFVGLEAAMHKIPEELSIGMRRRLEIARALVGWPPIMLFDEPTSGLDPINAKQVMDLILHAYDIHKISLLYVTKELHEIPYLATHYAIQGDEGTITVLKGEKMRSSETKVLVLDEGKFVFCGTPEEFETSTLPTVSYLTHPETSPIVKSSHHLEPLHKGEKFR